jgi:hypothetical protein
MVKRYWIVSVEISNCDNPDDPQKITRRLDNNYAASVLRTPSALIARCSINFGSRSPVATTLTIALGCALQPRLLHLRLLRWKRNPLGTGVFPFLRANIKAPIGKN